MSSLYQISEDLLNIFANIEENEGEVTEEELLALEIKQEELNEKLASYKKAIRVWNADIDACKAEEKRLKDARSVKENRINKLKDRMLNAVITFGYEGKPNAKGKSNHYYELPDGRMYTRTTESVELDENRLIILKNLIPAVCSESYKLDIIGNPLCLNQILELINEQLHIYYEGVPDFTITDLNNIRFDYKDYVDITDLIFSYSGKLKNKGIDVLTCGVDISTDKQQLKLVLNDPDKDLTIAKLKETQSLTIK